MPQPPPITAEPTAPPPRRRPGFVQIAHAVALVALVAAVKAGADRWGWATLLAYAPRWPWLLPGGLVTLVAMARRRSVWLTVAVTVGAGVWLLDAHAPLPRFGPAAATRLRVMTLNADGGNTAGRGTDPARIGRLIANARPDLIFLQEWRLAGPPPLPPGDWNVRRDGQIMVISRCPVDTVTTLTADRLLGDSNVFAVRVRVAPGVPLWLIAPHLETPRRGFARVMAGHPDGLELTARLATRRQTVSADAVDWVTALAGDADVMAAGDFNLVADGHVFRTTWARHFADAFETAGWGTGGTKLQTGWRPRIDHVLTGHAWRATGAWVGPDVGSDHLPLLADVQRP